MGLRIRADTFTKSTQTRLYVLPGISSRGHLRHGQARHRFVKVRAPIREAGTQTRMA